MVGLFSTTMAPRMNGEEVEENYESNLGGEAQNINGIARNNGPERHETVLERASSDSDLWTFVDGSLEEERSQSVLGDEEEEDPIDKTTNCDAPLDGNDSSKRNLAGSSTASFIEPPHLIGEDDSEMHLVDDISTISRITLATLGGGESTRGTFLLLDDDDIDSTSETGEIQEALACPTMASIVTAWVNFKYSRHLLASMSILLVAGAAWWHPMHNKSTTSVAVASIPREDKIEPTQALSLQNVRKSPRKNTIYDDHDYSALNSKSGIVIDNCWMKAHFNIELGECASGYLEAVGDTLQNAWSSMVFLPVGIQADKEVTTGEPTDISRRKSDPYVCTTLYSGADRLNRVLNWTSIPIPAVALKAASATLRLSKKLAGESTAAVRKLGTTIKNTTTSKSEDVYSDTMDNWTHWWFHGRNNGTDAHSSVVKGIDRMGDFVKSASAQAIAATQATASVGWRLALTCANEGRVAVHAIGDAIANYSSSNGSDVYADTMDNWTKWWFTGNPDGKDAHSSVLDGIDLFGNFLSRASLQVATVTQKTTKASWQLAQKVAEEGGTALRSVGDAIKCSTGYNVTFLESTRSRTVNSTEIEDDDLSSMLWNFAQGISSLSHEKVLGFLNSTIDRICDMGAVIEVASVSGAYDAAKSTADDLAGKTEHGAQSLSSLVNSFGKLLDTAYVSFNRVVESAKDEVKTSPGLYSDEPDVLFDAASSFAMGAFSDIRDPVQQIISKISDVASEAVKKRKPGMG